MHAEMGKGRKTGTQSASFISTVLRLIDDFYGNVIQDITPWQPPAPKLTKPSPISVLLEDREAEAVDAEPPLTTHQPPPPWAEG